jgi:hypothetical protein
VETLFADEAEISANADTLLQIFQTTLPLSLSMFPAFFQYFSKYMHICAYVCIHLCLYIYISLFLHKWYIFLHIAL